MTDGWGLLNSVLIVVRGVRGATKKLCTGSVIHFSSVGTEVPTLGTLLVPPYIRFHLRVQLYSLVYPL
jgi:hypothetical protein